MTREKAIEILSSRDNHGMPCGYTNGYVEALDMAIEALKAKCPTCYWCSDHQESRTRCPIEEHYALPKDGYCHLYEPYKAESEDKE